MSSGSSSEQVLAWLRRTCLALPEVSEAVTFGNPTFRAGKKSFAVLDEYQGRRCVCFKAGLEIVPALLEDPRFFQEPHGAQHGWVCMDVGGKIDWAALNELVVQSYRLVALKRMLAALDSEVDPG